MGGMMPDTPITWEQLGAAIGTVVAIVVAVLKLWDAIKKANAEQTKAISEKIEESRKQSEEGRRRLYESIGKIREECGRPTPRAKSTTPTCASSTTPPKNYRDRSKPCPRE